jgi:glycerol-3-phosphate dehydrogenase (NAD(P)+)
VSVAVVGAGAFGTALAIALAQKTDVLLWSRSSEQVEGMRRWRSNRAHLDGHPFPDGIWVSADLSDTKGIDTVLIAIPMQKLRQFLMSTSDVLAGKRLVACCKGIDLETGLGPLETIAHTLPTAKASLLTGPSFASDIARGLPTALVLACDDAEIGALLQAELSTRSLRLYRTTDIIGASLGGALKNVVAIAAGAAIGAGLGESARAALMTRGFVEMQRFALHRGARVETMGGLSGFGDLVLTCTSAQSRNYRLGCAIGQATTFDPDITVEGAATARAVDALARAEGLDMPITSAVAALLEKRLDVAEAMDTLLARSLKEE